MTIACIFLLVVWPRITCFIKNGDVETPFAFNAE